MTAEERSAAAGATTGTTGPRPFRRDIQGLRAVAVGLVLLDHAGLRVFSGGFVGVDVFFVISGFLISSHLLGELSHRGRIDFPSFYAARARRILPASIATIVSTAAVALLLVSPLRLESIIQDALASALYVPNVLFAARGTDYLAGTAPSPFQHFWSLGVEEQFYLVWPVLLLLVFRLSRESRRFVLWAIAGVAVISLAASVVLTSDSQPIAFFSPHTRAWEFAVGALAAGLATVLVRVPRGAAQLLSWVGLAAILTAALLYRPEMDYPGLAAMLPVLGAVLILAFGGRGNRGAGVLLSRRPMQFVGAISYSLYLVHWPVLVLAHEVHGVGVPLPTLTSVALAVASVPLAWVMYRFVETPFRTRRQSERPRSVHSRVLAVAAATTVVLVAALGVTGSVVERMPLTSDQEVHTRTLGVAPISTPVVPVNIAPALAAATRDTGAIYTERCQQGLSGAEVLSCSFGAVDSEFTIALFGDSHAGRWFPALDAVAAGLDYRLDTYTKSGCRSEETRAAWDTSANATCSVWRNDVVAMLNATPPDVIVLANHLGPRPGQDPTGHQAEWTEGLSSILDRLPQSSRVIMMSGTPEFASSPVLCLSSHLNDAATCAVPRSSAFNPSIRAAQQAAATEHGATVLDLTDYFCNATDCPAVIGHRLVYSDEHHVTATFSRALAPALQELMAPAIGASR